MTPTRPAADAWQSAYNNAAERLYGKVEGDILTSDEDDACIREANIEAGEDI